MYLLVFLGVFVRTLWPYFQAYKKAHDAGQPFKFETKYAVTFLFALGAALATAQPLFAAYVPPTASSDYVAALFAFLYGAGLNQVINTLADKGLNA